MQQFGRIILVSFFVSGIASENELGVAFVMPNVTGAESMIKRAWTALSELSGIRKVFQADRGEVSAAVDTPVNGHQDLPKWFGEQQKHYGHYGERMQDIQKLHDCAQKCGWDKACREKCPKPWELMEKKCMELISIKTCHESCSHDVKCLKRCPSPQSSHKAKEVMDAASCHTKCGAEKDGRACHVACQLPWIHMEKKCERLQKVAACHKGCVYGDHACHRKCFELEQHNIPQSGHGHRRSENLDVIGEEKHNWFRNQFPKSNDQGGFSLPREWQKWQRHGHDHKVPASRDVWHRHDYERRENYHGEFELHAGHHVEHQDVRKLDRHVWDRAERWNFGPTGMHDHKRGEILTKGEKPSEVPDFHV